VLQAQNSATHRVWVKDEEAKGKKQGEFTEDAGDGISVIGLEDISPDAWSKYPCESPFFVPQVS
jgi:hypothetical protein